MTVDSFKYLPRIIAFYYQKTAKKSDLPTPWTPLSKPIRDSKFGLVTSGGLYNRQTDKPFNIEREEREPTWGDPTFRKIPVDIDPIVIGASHLHIKVDDILNDINILLPIHRFQELVTNAKIGGLNETAYSFMGYQGFPPDSKAWRDVYAPTVAQDFIENGVDCVLLTPA
jgi:D-proline reductase (dithiol) PrdB